MSGSVFRYSAIITCSSDVISFSVYELLDLYCELRRDLMKPKNAENWQFWISSTKHCIYWVSFAVSRCCLLLMPCNAVAATYSNTCSKIGRSGTRSECWITLTLADISLKMSWVVCIGYVYLRVWVKGRINAFLVKSVMSTAMKIKVL